MRIQWFGLRITYLKIEEEKENTNLIIIILRA